MFTSTEIVPCGCVHVWFGGAGCPPGEDPCEHPKPTPVAAAPSSAAQSPHLAACIPWKQIPQGRNYATATDPEPDPLPLHVDLDVATSLVGRRTASPS